MDEDEEEGGAAAAQAARARRRQRRAALEGMPDIDADALAVRAGVWLECGGVAELGWVSSCSPGCASAATAAAARLHPGPLPHLSTRFILFALFYPRLLSPSQEAEDVFGNAAELLAVCLMQP